MHWIEMTFRAFEERVSSAVIFSHAYPTAALHPGCAARISGAARAFGKPVLYLMGDGHKWVYDRPFAAKNILRVQVDMGAIAPPVLVRVTDDGKRPFYFDRRIKGATTQSSTQPSTRAATTRSGPR